MEILRTNVWEENEVCVGARQERDYFDSKTNTVLFKTYIKSLGSYSFIDLKIIPENLCVYQAIKTDLEYQNNIDSEYLFVDQKFLVDELYWSEEMIAYFLLNFIELLDYPKDKFLLYKELYSKKSSFYLKIRKSLRNIKLFPICKEELNKATTFAEQLELMYLFKRYLIF